MRRADRLFRLIQLLRRRKVITARTLAEYLEVSERTIYRDVRDLILSGVPVEGEPGLGYMLRGYDLPPLMFSEEELEALVLGARTVRAWADPDLAQAAEEALDKIEVVLPDKLRQRVGRSAVFSLNFQASEETSGKLAVLRQALRQGRKVRIQYSRANGGESERVVWPLSLALVAPIWLFSGWCELRSAFRSFRVDRIQSLEVLSQRVPDEPGRTLEDFLRQVRDKETEQT
jgi:predicted DNA-binding transcriptional regulator YafY